MKQEAASKWLKGIAHAETCINAVFSLIAPDLFRTGLSAMQEIKGNVLESTCKNVKHSVECYPSVFSGLSPVANKKVPSHRDTSSRYQDYDLVYSAGGHDNARFDVVDLAGSFTYKPGCLIALCGSMFRHQVMEYEGQDRLCIAHFMRPDVLRRLGQPETPWVSIEPILGKCATDFEKINRFAWLLEEQKRTFSSFKM